MFQGSLTVGKKWPFSEIHVDVMMNNHNSRISCLSQSPDRAVVLQRKIGSEDFKTGMKQISKYKPLQENGGSRGTA